MGSAALLGSAGIATGGVGLANARSFVVSRHVLPLPGLRAPLRLAQLTDLHYGPLYGIEEVRRWVSAAMNACPDLIVVTGDFVDRWVSPQHLNALLTELAVLRAPLGVYGVPGNHDYALPVYEGLSREAWLRSFRAALGTAGITLLVNEGRQVRSDLWLCGVDDLWKGAPDIGASLGGANPNEAVILLSHNPDLLPKVPRRVGLTLCGHTHGGQVRLPLIGALHVPSKYGNRFSQGFSHLATTGFVSRGLGTTGPPARLNCPAEVVLLNVLPSA